MSLDVKLFLLFEFGSDIKWSRRFKYLQCLWPFTGSQVIIMYSQTFFRNSMMCAPSQTLRTQPENSLLDSSLAYCSPWLENIRSEIWCYCIILHLFRMYSSTFVPFHASFILIHWYLVNGTLLMYCSFAWFMVWKS